MLGLAIGLGFGARTAEARPAETSVVVDAFTGQIVSDNNSEAPNYPASLTKMMTLYLTFDALQRGRISLDTRFIVSNHAARQAPSKLGLMPGETITVHDLILAMVTKSANDAAVTMAEGLAGNEPAFAARMTKTAHALGMRRTQFLNASGLPHPGQITTARDIATLAIALYRDFPKQYAYFATESFTWRGETFGNHNHLMEAFEGMDGIKTGFINASGFNLAASAVRNGRRLVGVVLGGRSAESRDMAMAELLDDGFSHRVTSTGTMLGANIRQGSKNVVQVAADETAPLRSATATVPAPAASASNPVPVVTTHIVTPAPAPAHMVLVHRGTHGRSGRFAVWSPHHHALVTTASVHVVAHHHVYHHGRYGGRYVSVAYRHHHRIYAKAVLVHHVACHASSHHHCAPLHHHTMTAMNAGASASSGSGLATPPSHAPPASGTLSPTLIASTNAPSN